MARLPFSNNKFPPIQRVRVSIRNKLTVLMLLIGLLPTIIVGTIGFVTTSNELRAKTVEQLISTASKQEQKLSSALQQRQEEITTLTNRFDLQSALGRYLTSGSAQAETDLDAILSDRKVQSPEVQLITLTDLKGKVLASTSEGIEGKTLPADQYFVQPGSQSSVTVREDQRDGINKLYIASNVSVNKKEAGVVVMVFRIDDIVATVQDYTGLGVTGETLVAYKDGRGDAISLFPLRFNTDAALLQNVNSLQMFGATAATHTATDYRGHQVIVAARPIGFADWTMATKIDVDEALAPIVQLRSAFYVTLAFSSAAILLFALWLTRFFTKPILEIAQVAQRIGQGDFAARVDLRRNDEIGVLGDNVNAMGMSLHDFVAHIESERHRLEVILNSTAESILAIDKHGIILLANRAAAELSHQAQSQLVGRSIQEVFAWTHEQLPYPIDYAAEGTNVYPDLQYADSAGAVHYARIIVAKVSDEQAQKTAQTIVTIHDETKTRELENMKIDFVSMAAHELRTPLASLRGYIELISYKEGQHVSDEANKYLRQALKSSNELGSLINNLLDVTRIERGTMTLTMGKVDLAATVAQAVADMHIIAADKHIELAYEGPHDGCWVIGDHIALHEVVTNLLTNALKYTANGSVTVTLAHEKQHFAVKVRDTGIGIPKRALPYLFTKFYRVHGGLDSGSTGTGLGLYISKSIVQRHNGTIGVESQEGVGTTFSFTIPVFDDERYRALQTEKQSEQTFIRRHRGWVTKNITR